MIIPRNSLKWQGEQGYNSPYFRTEKTARADTCTGNPFRGCDSVFVTFQSVCSNPEKWIEIFTDNQVMLVIDEAHHLSDNGDWIKTISTLKDRAFLSVFLTGTPFRGDETKIPFFPYDLEGNLDMSDTKTTRWISYTNKDALRDGNILPFEAKLINGSGAYVDLDGITRSFRQFSNKGDELRCAFMSEFAFHFLDIVFSDWLEYKSNNYFAKCLIVAYDIKTAKTYLDYIKEKYPSVRVGIATSEDSKSCKDIIERSKIDNRDQTSIECLVSVGVAYEGLDIPECSHLACMTVIRSLQWLTQCIGRCTRVADGKENGFVYAPEDKKMLNVLKLIEGGTIKAATGEAEEKQKGPSRESSGEARTIQALHSKAHVQTQNNLPFPKYVPVEKTISEQETDLRKTVNKMVKDHLDKTDHGNKQVKNKLFWLRIKSLVNNGRDENGKLIKKPLKDMSVKELKKVKEYLDSITM